MWPQKTADEEIPDDNKCVPAVLLHKFTYIADVVAYGRLTKVVIHLKPSRAVHDVNLFSNIDFGDRNPVIHAIRRALRDVPSVTLYVEGREVHSLLNALMATLRQERDTPIWGAWSTSLAPRRRLRTPSSPTARLW